MKASSTARAQRSSIVNLEGFPTRAQHALGFWASSRCTTIRALGFRVQGLGV